MALKKKGNLAFALQAGARGPVADTTTGMYRRDEEWEGQETDLTAFLASKPPGSAHPAYPYLKVYEVEPTMNEAGMARVRITYTGHPTGASTPTLQFQKSLRTGAVGVKIVRRYERMVAFTLYQGEIISSNWVPVSDEADAEMAFSYFAPSVTFRYCRSQFIKSPQFSAQANAELAGQTPEITKSNIRQTTPNFTTTSGTNLNPIDSIPENTTSDLQGQINRLAAEKRNLRISYEYEGSSIVGQPYFGTPVIRSTDLTCEQRGSMFEVQETWEIALV